MISQLYAPHVFHFAYHLRDEKGGYDWLEEQCQKIRAQFPQLQEPQGKDLKLRSKDDTPKKTHFYCLADGKKSRVYKSIDQSCQSLRVSPQIIDDCEALEIVSRINQQANQDVLDIADLGTVLNPKNCLNLSQLDDPNFMGQTLLVTAFLDPQNSNPSTAIATEVLANILHTDPNRLPDFYQEDTLFGSPLFEFGNPRFDPLNDHLLVLFFSNDSSSKQFVNFLYPKLCRLLCYYHKVLYAFNAAHQEDYHAAKPYREKIISIIESLSSSLEDKHNVPSKVLSVPEIQVYKQKLKNLYQANVKCSEISRSIEHRLNTLIQNQGNYQKTLQGLQSKSGDSLSCFQIFVDDELRGFHAQIHSDLKYLELDVNLSSRGTNAIPGLFHFPKNRFNKEGNTVEERKC